MTPGHCPSLSHAPGTVNAAIAKQGCAAATRVLLLRPICGVIPPVRESRAITVAS
jgi:hypothetical protein